MARMFADALITEDEVFTWVPVAGRGGLRQFMLCWRCGRKRSQALMEIRFTRICGGFGL
jgi:hypothetical protein